MPQHRNDIGGFLSGVSANVVPAPIEKHLHLLAAVPALEIRGGECVGPFLARLDIGTIPNPELPVICLTR